MLETQSAAAAPAQARKWDPGATWSRWAPWLNRGALSSIDQGLASGANFALSVMLARWLPISDYGGYSVALSFFMLISAAQQALFLEPMSVLGASRFADCQREYVAVLRGINTLFGVASGLCAAGFITVAWVRMSECPSPHSSVHSSG